MEVQKKFDEIIPKNLRPKIEQIQIQKKFKQDEIVFHENDHYTGFYLVRSGKFKVYNLNYEGKEAILHIFLTGTLIAAAPVFHDIETFYPATCQAIEGGSLSFFEAVEFRNLLKQSPDFSFQFSSLTMNLMRTLRDKTASLMLSDVRTRILDLFKEYGGMKDFIELPIPKNQIALLVGTTPETLSRTLKILEDENILIKKENKYKINMEQDW
jgi:CRP/FNR family transcriptional regulator